MQGKSEARLRWEVKREFYHDIEEGVLFIGHVFVCAGIIWLSLAVLG